MSDKLSSPTIALERKCPICLGAQTGTRAVDSDPATEIYWHSDGSGDDCYLELLRDAKGALRETLGLLSAHESVIRTDFGNANYEVAEKKLRDAFYRIAVIV